LATNLKISEFTKVTNINAINAVAGYNSTSNDNVQISMQNLLNGIISHVDLVYNVAGAGKVLLNAQDDNLDFIGNKLHSSLTIENNQLMAVGLRNLLASVTELNSLQGVSSNVQTQLNDLRNYIIIQLATLESNISTQISTLTSNFNSQISNLQSLISSINSAHNIIDIDEAVFPNRAGLQFRNGFAVEDNSTTNKTIVDTMSARDYYNETISSAVPTEFNDHIANTNIHLRDVGDNIAAGTNSLANNTAYDNVAIGRFSLENNTRGAFNVAIGPYSLVDNTTGLYNIGIGYFAMTGSNHHNYNIAIGQRSLGLLGTATGTTQQYNVAIGHEAAYGAESKGMSYAIAIGGRALYKGASHNIAIGHEALYETSGSSALANVAVGIAAGKENSTGYFNTLIGAWSGTNNTTGSGNSLIGYNALAANITGSNNIAIGREAGAYLAGGSAQQTIANDSIFIGSNTRGPITNDQTNQIVIGYGAIGYGSNTAHIGNTSLASISYGAATGTAFTNRSDPRIKENIQDADLDICIDNVKKLPLHYFNYKNFVGNEGDQHVLGFLSPEFGEILPKAVHRNTTTFDERDENGDIVYEIKNVDEFISREVEVVDPETGETRTELQNIQAMVTKSLPKQVIIEDCESIDSSQLVPILWGAVQKLIAKVEELEAKINE